MGRKGLHLGAMDPEIYIGKLTNTPLPTRDLRICVALQSKSKHGKFKLMHLCQVLPIDQSSGDNFFPLHDSSVTDGEGDHPHRAFSFFFFKHFFLLWYWKEDVGSWNSKLNIQVHFWVGTWWGSELEETLRMAKVNVVHISSMTGGGCDEGIISPCFCFSWWVDVNSTWGGQCFSVLGKAY